MPCSMTCQREPPHIVNDRKMSQQRRGDPRRAAQEPAAQRVGIPTLGHVLTRIMRTRTGRVGMLVAWAWVGLHFFAR